MDLPKNIKSFNTGSSLNKWNNKTSRLKTGQRNRVCSPKTTSRSIVTEDYEDSSLLDIIKNEYFNSKLGDSHEAETGAEAGAELYVDDLVNNNVENNQGNIKIAWYIFREMLKIFKALKESPKVYLFKFPFPLDFIYQIFF